MHPGFLVHPGMLSAPWDAELCGRVLLALGQSLITFPFAMQRFDGSLFVSLTGFQPVFGNIVAADAVILKKKADE